MIVTEEEAKTKRCQEGIGDPPPLAGASVGMANLSPHPFSFAGESSQSPPLVTNCIGSACMAWRPTNSGPIYKGYCGKAGKP